ncbi:MAG: hypothetical protein AB1700_15405, partial [Bacillota bacterium]
FPGSVNWQLSVLNLGLTPKGRPSPMTCPAPAASSTICGHCITALVGFARANLALQDEAHP